MKTPVEDPAVTPPAGSQTSRKMLQLLRKRLRQLMWATLGLSIFLVVAGPIFAIWWLNSLNGLPDIGDPFDVAKFRALRIPEDQNAFTFLRQAGAELTPAPEWPRAIDSADPTDVWSEANPKLRSWVEANRAALASFLRGADLSDGISRPAGQGYSRDYSLIKPRELVNLALLEGARRAEAGDTAGAWECYRGVLRTAAHFRRRGDVYERWMANSMQVPLQKGLATWAADPSTPIPQVRRALEEVLESRPRPEWEAFSLKLTYLDLTRDLEAPVDYIHRTIADEADLSAGWGRGAHRAVGVSLPGPSIPQARARAQPARPPADLRQLAGPPRGPRAAGKSSGRPRRARIREEHQQHVALPHQPQGPTRGPHGPTPDVGELGRLHPRPQIIPMGRHVDADPLPGSAELPPVGRVAGRGALSTRTRGDAALRGGLGGDLPRRTPRGRFGRARRWHGADRARFPGPPTRHRPGRNQLRISWTTSPWTSVRRKSRPAYRYVSLV